jgi:hypothetical protein
MRPGGFMRSSFRSVLLLAGLLLAASCFVHADTITISFSEYATGTVGSQSFTNQLLTYSGSFTTAQLAACQVDPSFNCAEVPGEIFFELMNGLTTTFTVGGLGTFTGTGRDDVDFDYSGSLTSIVPRYGGDFDHFLVIPTTPSFLGSTCVMNFPPFYCPIYAATSGGDLVLTSVGDTYTTEVLVDGVPLASSTPEPSSLTLLASGALGIFELVRRRLQYAGR